MEPRRHILISPETDQKIECIRKEMAREGITVSRTAIVAMAINEKAGRSETEK